jgi:hypothetical protein
MPTDFVKNAYFIKKVEISQKVNLFLHKSDFFLKFIYQMDFFLLILIILLKFKFMITTSLENYIKLVSRKCKILKFVKC